MQKIPVEQSGSDSDHERHIPEQFPVETNVIRTLRFDTGAADGDLLRIIVMNNQSTPEHLAFHEYHYGNDRISVDDIASFTLYSGALSGTQKEIADFVASMALRIDIPQSSAWLRGIYSAS